MPSSRHSHVNVYSYAFSLGQAGACNKMANLPLYIGDSAINDLSLRGTCNERRHNPISGWSTSFHSRGSDGSLSAHWHDVEPFDRPTGGSPFSRHHSLNRWTRSP